MEWERLQWDMSRQRRPAGRAYYTVTDDLRRRFVELSQTKTYREIADEFERAVGYRPDVSSFSHIKNRTHATSRIADDLAKLYGWPRPPRVGLYDDAFAVGDRVLRELHERSPERYAAVLEYAEMHLREQQAISKIRGTEEIRELPTDKSSDGDGEKTPSGRRRRRTRR